MKKSGKPTTLIDDLIKAQSQIEAVTKDGINPFFKSHYATLNATISACKDILNANGFAVIQPITSDAGGVYVCTTLIHTSGGQIESRMRIKLAKENDPQSQGSAITYARRYSLQSLLLMSAEDDDGEKAVKRSTPSKTYGGTTPTRPTSSKDTPASEGQKKMIFSVAKQKGMEPDEVKDAIKLFFKLDSYSKLTMSQAKKAIDNLLKKPDVFVKEFDVPKDI